MPIPLRTQRAGAPARRKTFLLKLRKLKNILHVTHFSSTISSIAKKIERRKYNNMKQDKTFLGTEPVGKLLFKLAVPTVIAQLVNMLYNIVDRIYIGHMPGDGSLALTGVGVCMPLIMIVSAFAALISSGGAPRASIAMGKGEHESAEKILGGCVTVQVVISLILTVVILVWNKDLLLAFGKYNFVCKFIYEFVCIWHTFCTADLGNECIYYGTGICKDRYVYGNDRCSG